MTKDEELELLRQENRVLQQENATLREELAQMKEHLHHLQEQSAKDSHNSSLPPSSDRFVRRTKSLREKSGKKPGGQKGHRGHHLMQVKNPDEVVHHRVERCAGCQADLRTRQGRITEHRQVFDLPVKRLWVIEHQAEEKQCPDCGKLTRASFPEAVRAPAQYGEGIAALAVYLVEGQCVAYARAAQLLQELLGVQVSAGSLARFLTEGHKRLEGVEKQIKEALIAAPVIHQDETGLCNCTGTSWVHVACTQFLTHYAAHPLRGRNGMQAIGISPAFGGISVHDGLLSYRAFDCEHAVCNAHHLRELTFVHEHYQQEWAAEMKNLLLLMKRRVQEAKEHGKPRLDPLTVAALSGEYDRLIASGWKINAESANGPPSEGTTTKKSRKHSDAYKLLHRLQVGKNQALAFLSNFAVPFDNNQAERDLRMLKVQQKVSGCWRTQVGIEQLCRIRSYLSTLHKQGMGLLQGLQQTLLGEPILPALQPPSE